MAYLPKLNPTVSGGLGGLPERTTGGLDPSKPKTPAAGTGAYLFTPWVVAQGGIAVWTIENDTFSRVEDAFDVDVSGNVARNGLAISEDGHRLLVSHAGSPNFAEYSRDGDSFTKQRYPDVMPGGGGRGVAISQNYIAALGSSSPTMVVWNRHTKARVPVTGAQPPVTPQGLYISQDEDYIAVFNNTTSPLQFYVPDGNGGFVNKTTSSTNASLNYGTAFAFSADGQIMVGVSDSQIRVMRKDVGAVYFRQVTSVNTGYYIEHIDISPDGETIAVGNRGGRHVYLYKFLNDTLTLLPALSPAIPSGAATVKFSGNSNYLLVYHGASPERLYIFKRLAGDSYTKLTLPYDLYYTASGSDYLFWHQQ
ncbi:MAG: hypothetical protein CMH98_01150 [Oceanospirillaceae bacterium]|nr:hypothetical protein [Oceanospirillaceae bacterium]